MKKIIFAVAATLFLLAGCNLMAQGNRPRGEREVPPTAEQIAQRRTDRMKEALQLSEEQTKQVYALNLESAKQMKAQREAAMADRKANAEKMKAILTAEQFEKWSQMQKARARSGRGHGAKKGMCGGDGRPQQPTAPLCDGAERQGRR